MTVKYGFYNSVNGDRTYNADDMSSLFEGIIHDGIFLEIGQAFNIGESTGMGVNVKTGRAWFNKTWTDNDSEFRLAIDPSNAVFGRIDVVALEIDTSDAVRANSVKVIKGTPSSTPVAPMLTNAGTLHQYPLAHVSVPANVTAIIYGNITNKVGTTGCPFVTGVLKNVDTVEIGAIIDNLNGMIDALEIDIANNTSGMPVGSAVRNANGDYTITLTPAPTSYVNGYAFICKFDKFNPNAYPTINVNGLGTKYLKMNGAAQLSIHVLQPGKYYTLIYDGTNVQILELTDAARSLAFGGVYWLYVDGVNGNDTSGDGTQPLPFKTINRALGCLTPYLANMNVAIWLAGGYDYGGLDIRGYVGGGIQVNKYGSGEVLISGQAVMERCDDVRFYNLKFTRTDGAAIIIQQCRQAKVDTCTIIGSAASYTGISATDVNDLVVVLSTISNHQTAIDAFNSTVLSSSNSGTGNSIGLRATSSTIMKNGTQPAGTTAESTSQGGVIR